MFEKVKNFVVEKKYVLATGIGAVGGSLPMIVNAQEPEADPVQSALTTAFSNVQTSVSGYVTAALPYALGIMALILGITIAVKAFKRFAK